MPNIDRLGLTGKLITSGLPLPPIEYNLFRVVDETNSHVIELADGAVDVAITVNIDTLQTLKVIAKGSVSIRPAGAGTTSFTLVGTVADPAVFVLWRTSTTSLPVMSNASGATVIVEVQAGGT